MYTKKTSDGGHRRPHVGCVHFLESMQIRWWRLELVNTFKSCHVAMCYCTIATSISAPTIHTEPPILICTQTSTWHWPSKKTTSAQGKLLPTDMKIDAQNCSTSHTNINNKHTKSKTLTQTDCHLGFFGWKATNLSFPKISKKTCIALEGIPSTSVHKQAPRQLRRQNFRQDKITEV